MSNYYRQDDRRERRHRDEAFQNYDQNNHRQRDDRQTEQAKAPNAEHSSRHNRDYEYQEENRNYRRGGREEFSSRRRRNEDYYGGGHEEEKPERTSERRRRTNDDHQEEPPSRRRRNRERTEEDPDRAKAHKCCLNDGFEQNDEGYQEYFDWYLTEIQKEKKKKQKGGDPFSKGDAVLVDMDGDRWNATVKKYLPKINSVWVAFEDGDNAKVDIKKCHHPDQAPPMAQDDFTDSQRRKHDKPEASRPKSQFSVGQKVKALFDEDGDEWLPAKVVSIDPLSVEFEGYEEEGAYDKEERFVRAVQDEHVVEKAKIRVGDRVKAPYEGEVFPGKVERIQGDQIWIAFDGYGEFEPYQVDLAACTLDESAPREAVAEAEAEAEIEEVQEDSKNLRPEPPTPRFQNRDTVWYFPDGIQNAKRPDDVTMRGSGEWENGMKCYIKGYQGAERGRPEMYDIQEAGRGGARHRNIPIDKLKMCGSAQQQAICVFAYLKKKYIPKNEFIDIYRGFFIKGGRAERCCTDREENHIFNEVYPKGDVHINNEGDMVWREEIDLPELPWWCPIAWDIPYGRLATVEEDGVTQSGRVKCYCPFEKVYLLEFKNYDADTKEVFKYPFEKLTMKALRPDQAAQVFGFYRKNVMSKRMFEGLWRLVTQEDKRPPSMENMCEPNGIPSEICKEVEDYGIKWIGDLPPFPEGEYFTNLEQNVPEFFNYDMVEIDCADIYEECQQQETCYVDGAPIDPTDLRINGKVTAFDAESGNYEVDLRFFEEGADQCFDGEKLKLWLLPGKIRRRLRRENKAEIIFGAFQQKIIPEKDFKLSAERFFDDRISSLKRFCDDIPAVDYDDEGRTVTWEADDLPSRPMEEHYRNPPRYWKQGNRVQYREEQSGRWLGCTVEAEEGYGTGTYKIKTRDDEFLSVDCTLLRPWINFSDKVRAVFSEAQKETLTFSFLSGRLNELFAEEITGGDFGVFESLSDQLRDGGIDVDYELQVCRMENIPQPDLMKVWALKQNMSFGQRIDQVFVMSEKEVMSFQEFNGLFEQFFDDSISNFERTFENKSDKYEIDFNGETIKVINMARLGGGDSMVSWGERFKDKKIDWEEMRKSDNYIAAMQSMFIEDADSQNREWDELEKFWEAHKVQYHSEDDNEQKRPDFPRPVFSFEEAFKRYANDGEIGHVAKQILDELNKQFKTPTPIQKCCWPALFTKRDILGISKTGSGKTLTFGLPMILKVAKQKRQVSDSFGTYCHALICVPTRELAGQHVAALKPYCEMANLKIMGLYGGNRNFREQTREIEDGVDIVVATVGRLLHFIDEKYLSLKNTGIIILDEADEMLRGFEEGIRSVLCHQIRPSLERQCLLFSATYADEVMELEHAFYSNDPLRISVGAKTVMADPNVTQLFAMTNDYRENEQALYATLEYIIRKDSKSKVLVFCNAKNACDELNGNLLDNKNPIIKHSVWHSGIDQQMREDAVDGLKKGLHNVIICTDVACRGIDIDDLTVVQYGFPRQGVEQDDGRERYIHRLGRAGRALKQGNCYTIDKQAPEGWEGELMEILKDVNQVCPEGLYERCGESIPDDIELPPNIPEWAGGFTVAEMEISSIPEENDDPEEKYRTVNVFGNGNQFKEVLTFFNPSYSFSGNEIPSAQFDAEATKAGLTLKAYMGGMAWTPYEPEAFGSGEEEKLILFCPADMTLSPVDHFRPIVNYKEWKTASSKRRGQKGRRQRGKTSSTKPLPTSIIPKHVVSIKSNTMGDWTNQRCNVWWAADNQSYPATCTHDDGTEWATCTFDDPSFGETQVERKNLSALGDKVLDKVVESGKVGLKVQALYLDDGQYYDATIKDDYQNGSYLVEYDAGGEADLNEDQITGWPEAAAAEAAAPAAGVAAKVEFGGEYYPASVADNGDGTYYVTYENTEFGVEEAVAAARIDFGGKTVQVEYQGEYYTATAVDNGDGTFYVTYEDTSFGVEEACPASRIKDESAPAAAAAASADVGKAIQVEYEGEYYPAKMKSDNGDGTFTVIYDDETFAEETVPKDRIKQEAIAAPAASAFSVGPVQAWFGEDDGSYQPAKITSIDGEGYHVVFDGFEADGESLMQEDSLKAVEAAAAGGEQKFPNGPVNVYFEADEAYLPGQIRAFQDNQYEVCYDGFEEWLWVTEDYLQAQEAQAPKATFKYSVGEENLEGLFAADGEFYAISISGLNDDGSYAVLYTEYEETGVLQETEIRHRAAAAAPASTFSVGESGLEGLYKADGNHYAVDITAINGDGTYQVLYTEYAEEATLKEDQIRRQSASDLPMPPPVVAPESNEVVEENPEEQAPIHEANLEPQSDQNEGAHIEGNPEIAEEISAVEQNSELPIPPPIADAEPQDDQNEVAQMESSAAAAAGSAFKVGETGLEGAYGDQGDFFAIEILAVNADGSYNVNYTEYGEVTDLTADQIQRSGNQAAAAPSFSIGQQGLEGKYAADGEFYAIEITAINGNEISVVYTEYSEEAVITAGDIRLSVHGDQAAAADSSFDVRQEGLEGKYEADGEYYAIDITAVNGDQITVVYTQYSEEATISASNIRQASGAGDSGATEMFEPEQAGVDGKFDGEWHPIKILSRNDVDNTYTVIFTDYPDEGEVVLQEFDLRNHV